MFLVFKTPLVPTRCQLFRNISTDRNAEIWKQIPDFPKYQASNFGRIRHNRTKRIRMIDIEKLRMLKIRPQISIRNAQGKSLRFLSRMVLSAFDPIRNMDELQTNHKDGDPYNNHIDNLEWVTGRQNMRHAIENGLICRQKCAVKMIDLESGREIKFNSIKDCAIFCKENGISNSISSPRFRRRTIIKNFQFMYMDESKYQFQVKDLPGEVWEEFAMHSISRWKYFVSSQARIKVVKADGRVELRQTYYGNRQKFYHPVERGLRSLSMLVARHFVPNPSNYRYIVHKDCDPFNDTASNLQWIPTLKARSNAPQVSRKRTNAFSQAIIKRKFVHDSSQSSGSSVRSEK